MATTRETTICNKLGLHVRAATQLVQMATDFDLELKIEVAGQEGDLKSIMEVLMLAVTNGTDVTLHAEGDTESEEEDALNQLTSLIQNKFNEKE
ncbi:MAG: HPr family phosphocarrier protein [SAR324 cluster bacterium]|nr:HPr family phosphocarrier protein [SAR324 cluster bacterium]